MKRRAEESLPPLYSAPEGTAVPARRHASIIAAKAKSKADKAPSPTPGPSQAADDVEGGGSSDERGEQNLAAVREASSRSRTPSSRAAAAAASASALDDCEVGEGEEALSLCF